MGEDSTTEDYSMLIESMCRWNKQDDILELIIEWLDAALHSEQEDSQVGIWSGLVSLKLVCS